jgi:hypothetical protein
MFKMCSWLHTSPTSSAHKSICLIVWPQPPSLSIQARVASLGSIENTEEIEKAVKEVVTTGEVAVEGSKTGGSRIRTLRRQTIFITLQQRAAVRETKQLPVRYTWIRVSIGWSLQGTKTE